MLGHKLVTKQTTSDGILCRKLMVVEQVGHDTEFYVSLALNVQSLYPLLIFSKEGGTSIEEKSKESILITELKDSQTISESVGKIQKMLGGKLQYDEVSKFLNGLLSIFQQKDCTLVEINPGTVLDGKILCLDAKINVDENALYRQPELAKIEESREVTTKGLEGLGMNYIRLDGNIACLVNGAGLSMATMDLISHLGGRPANFLDIGGAASKSQIADALRMINKDGSIKAVFINIFGGIIKCDSVAEAMVRTDFKKPVMVRLKGMVCA